jgi:hypothetical protein
MKSEWSNDESGRADFFSRFGFRHSFVIRHSCFVIGTASTPDQNKVRLSYGLSNLWVTRLALVKRPCRSAYAAERKARFLACSELASCSIRRRSAAHLCSSSAIWRESSAAPIAEIGIVRRNSASPASKATLLLGIVHSFVFTIWS